MAMTAEGKTPRRYTMGGFYPGQGEGGDPTNSSGFASIGSPGGSQSSDTWTGNPFIDTGAWKEQSQGQSGGETGPGSGGFNPSITGFNSNLAQAGLQFASLPGFGLPGAVSMGINALGSGLGAAKGFNGLSNENGPVDFNPGPARALGPLAGLFGSKFTGTDPATGEAGAPIAGFDLGGPQGPGIQGPGMTSLGRSGEGRSAADMTFATLGTPRSGGINESPGPPSGLIGLDPTGQEAGIPSGLTGLDPTGQEGGQGPGPGATGGNTGSGTGTGAGDTGAGGTGDTSGTASMRGGLITKNTRPNPSHWAEGGLITQGDPNAQQDDVPAMLHEGEFVIPKPAMEQLARKTGGYQKAAQQIKELVIRFSQAPMDGMEQMYQKQRSKSSDPRFTRPTITTPGR